MGGFSESPKCRKLIFHSSSTLAAIFDGNDAKLTETVWHKTQLQSHSTTAEHYSGTARSSVQSVELYDGKEARELKSTIGIPFSFGT
uniref:PLAT domain-containing protein n=1 Tax=Ascaris lumbricoides TaxID=6252 RepID=A0A0M3I219_ASCLU